MVSDIRRAAILFAGGPAPGANAVIAAAAISFLESGREVLGLSHGYSNLQDYDPAVPLVADVDYRVFTDAEVRSLRNTRGVRIGTSRANPGGAVEKAADLLDPKKTARLRNVYRALVDLGVDALVSIGGDDTLKTANLLFEYQKTLPPEAKRVRVVHLPKTIDNDYRGIDFTFGFFTAVDVMAKEVQNLRADAMATASWFVVETMGRKAGWLSYGVAIAGEADLVIASEDTRDLVGGNGKLDVAKLADRVLDAMLLREAHGEHYGTVVLAEGLAELLPADALSGVDRDAHGHIPLGRMDLGKMVAGVIAARYKARTGRSKKVTGVQIGYESRCALPHAFDVMLGSQLGIGAYRGLVEEGLDGHMVSVEGQLDLVYVPFHELVNAENLRTEVRFITPDSDFHRLARFLERRTGPGDWTPGRRREP
jgi:6-phosphofructokinase